MSVFQADVLAGRVALITGGGSGICKGIAHAYLAHGANVCICGRKQERLDNTVAELGEATGGEIVGIACDVRHPDQVERLVAATVERFGKLDTLVNGAAGNFLAPAAGLRPKGFKTVIEIDLLGSFQVAHACFEPLHQSGDGLVLNISATLHYHGTPMQVHASAAKAGVDALTRNLAVEWGALGIRANAIAPGAIDDTEGMRKLAPGGLRDQFVKHIPLRRYGTIQDIADMAVFVRTSAGAYINGAILVVDGGQCVVAPGMSEFMTG